MERRKPLPLRCMPKKRVYNYLQVMHSTEQISRKPRALLPSVANHSPVSRSSPTLGTYYSPRWRRADIEKWNFRKWQSLLRFHDCLFGLFVLPVGYYIKLLRTYEGTRHNPFRLIGVGLSLWILQL